MLFQERSHELRRLFPVLTLLPTPTPPPPLIRTELVLGLRPHRLDLKATS